MDDILTNVTPDADNPVDTGSDDGDKQVFDQIQGSDNFFEELDKSVNPSFYESEAESQETQETDPPTEAQTEAVDQTQGDHDWEKRYADSSREAQKLNGRMKELEPFLPILDAMRDDPNLVSHVKGYFEGGGETPKSMKETLGLDEDFVFDSDEAINNPSSDSGKVFNATVDSIVRNRVRDFASKEAQTNQRKAEEATFMKENEMSPEQFPEIMDWANSRTMKLDDILYLRNKGSRDNQIRTNAQDGVRSQMQRMSNRPQSVSSKGSTPVEPDSAEDEVFKAIKGVDSDIENIFGV